ncbi:hypothetical protein RvY_06392 [Ramazzottius varieornatus]|uniref:Calcium-transporting ATPase n=1 Tax=Ramazzottius varieornatus TaxID=947166 RepID=A0A1D1UYZ1_RAMVA|nr:hypothetical protein RvY_06392 [Ramazzottius varieornatus]
MCPYTRCQSDNAFMRRMSSLAKDGNDVLIDVLARNFEISAETLCRLLKLPGQDVRAKVEDDYGSVLDLCTSLQTSPINGISAEADEVSRRTNFYGPNVIPVRKPKTFAKLMWMALKEPTLIILEIAAVVSLCLAIWNSFRAGADSSSHDWIEGLAIAIGVLVIVLVSAANDYGKERQFQVLQNKVREEHRISVIRNGVAVAVPVQNLVVGDLCQLKYGDIVPADGLVLQSHELMLDESSLTGESDPVRKDADIDCKLLSGTHVIEGSGKMLVLAVGLNSQTGSIYKMLGVVREKKASKVKKETDVKKQVAMIVVDGKHGITGNGLKTSEDSDVPLHAEKADDIERKQKNHSVFQNKLNIMAYKIGLLGFVCASATSTIIIVRFCVNNYGILKKPWRTEDITTIMDAIVVGITILVSAIPEGLPLAVTLTLAFSAKKMMADKNLVRHLFACETMGCATTICSDKTGTLTTNRMTVTEAWFGDKIRHAPFESSTYHKLAYEAIAINSGYASEVVPSLIGDMAEQRGNKTECALLQFVSSVGGDYSAIRVAHPEESFVKVYTFNSSRKSMTTVIAIPGGWRVFCKGAAEIVLAKCRSLRKEDGSLTDMTEKEAASISQQVITAMASNGLRTICVACKDIVGTVPPNFDDEAKVVDGLTCLAIFGIEDPVRPEVPKAIQRCQQAGVTVRMVTGDNVNTARAIARKCGIIPTGETDMDHEKSLVLEGQEFNSLVVDKSGRIDQDKLDLIWPRLRVLARSTPKDKFTLVEGIINSKVSKHREVVAVTGDGTNDAPALKKADVGFAMGMAGTDVAKEASDIIITDDNFSSIVKAIMWGRNIYDNVAKFLQFQLTVNVAALSVAIIAACSIGDTPLKAVPMLWVNMIQDTLGSLALATEPPGQALLERKPYGRKKRLISTTIGRNILGQGIYQSVVLLCILYCGPAYFDVYEKREIGHVVGQSPSQIYTLVFNTLVIMTSFNLINARCIHNEVNVFKGIFSNLYFPVLWTVMLITQVIVVEVGGIAFSTAPLTAEMWGVSLFFGVGSLLWYQVLRLLPIKWRKQRTTLSAVKIRSS